MADSSLYFGDNLDILRRYIADESVDLIYLDPPFNSQQTYNIMFREQNGSDSASQINAFEDTWHWGHSSVSAWEEVVEGGGEPSQAMIAFRNLLGDNDMTAYLAMMAPRLIELRRVLKGTGSIYLHCDTTASHYLKLLLDAVFGPRQFRNEIIWWYYDKCPTGGSVLDRQHDSILQYSKSKSCTTNLVMEERVQPGRPTEVRKKVNGRMERIRDPKTGKTTFVEGTKEKRISDVWRMPLINSMSKERLGYPTQKPLALLRRIIETSSNEGDLVLDPFCGCGTTIAAAEALKRRWVGIDITHLAINLIKFRLQQAYGDAIEKRYTVTGEPVDLGGAKQLARQDPYGFQCWALGLVGARLAQVKKGADRGIDGILSFHDEPEGGKSKQVIISVKSGKLKMDDVRALCAVVNRQEADFGALLTLNSPTEPMKREAASVGTYSPPWDKTQKHPRIQLITVGELLAGAKIKRPYASERDVSIRRARKAKPFAPRQPELPLPE